MLHIRKSLHHVITQSAAECPKSKVLEHIKLSDVCDDFVKDGKRTKY
jgi:hypothetical protein